MYVFVGEEGVGSFLFQINEWEVVVWYNLKFCSWHASDRMKCFCSLNDVVQKNFLFLRSGSQSQVTKQNLLSRKRQDTRGKENKK